MTVMSLSPGERLSLIKGYYEGAGFPLPNVLVSRSIEPSGLGRELGWAERLLRSASVSEYQKDKLDYAKAAEAVASHYGDGVVAPLDDPGKRLGLIGCLEAVAHAEKATDT